MYTYGAPVGSTHARSVGQNTVRYALRCLSGPLGYVLHTLGLMEFQSTESWLCRQLSKPAEQGRAAGQPCCRTGDEMQVAGGRGDEGSADS